LPSPFGAPALAFDLRLRLDGCRSGAIKMRVLGIVALGAALGGCSVTVPVAVITAKGQVLRGATTASLTEGTFQATDGKLTCSGTYDPLFK
jgi:hypothetical protein